ncbi:Crp/Fnr family transcriptional regulator [Ekhidna sp.]|uniref:Crp/Fnr family transcriptional regulator n=1 Tax=Ekhidna sp. TaxID=2608089 RepID=UPI003296E4CB
MNSLKSYFEQELPLVDVQPLVDCFTTKKILKKGEKLVVPGNRASFLAFINKGAFRAFFINNKGNEITSWFSFEGMFITDLLAYYKGTQAEQFIEAIEESEISITQKSQLEKLYMTQPVFREFGRKFAEKGMIMVMERMLSLQTKSAEERYRDLLYKPQFLEKIPLKYLATYLGITDTSLSRIRKSIVL